MNKFVIFLVPVLLLFGLANSGTAQVFTKQDTLRGAITPERAWWDLTHYNLEIKIDPEQKTFIGSNIISYQVIEPNNVMQIDLQAPLKITKIVQDGNDLPFQKKWKCAFYSIASTTRNRQFARADGIL
ncbi:hypothetical protein [Ekhidna sp.]